MSTMMFRTCPSCRQQGLASTGAFLRCGHCGYAITAQALAREGRGVAPDHVRPDARARMKERLSAASNADR